MDLGSRLKVFLLVIGDIIVLYASLLLALALRYGTGFYEQLLDIHLRPFTIIFIPWLVIFYVAGLYDLRRLRNNIDSLKTLSLSILVNAIVAVLLFYLVPAIGIAPKTNLFIFIIIFTVIEIGWRRLFNRTTASGEAPNKVLLVGRGATIDEIAKTIADNNQLGYAVMARMDEDAAAEDPNRILDTVRDNSINLIVVPRELKRKSTLAPVLYALFGKGVLIVDLEKFYETIMRKVPLADIEETWFLENIQGAATFYDPLKGAIEFVLAFILGVVLIPVDIVIAILIKLTSRGPVIYKHTRVGTDGHEFTFYKFRSMRVDAEKNGAQWTQRNDPRETAVGRVLRKSHIDELPQLWNIIKGEMSFVGPRPERPEFVARLKKEIPFYEVRLLVKPGVTGWAQLNHHTDIDLADVKKKLQYDIYYIKNRSLILDIAIVLKTLKSFFVNPK